ncbi:MAG: GNAT family N-acetyltransferase [Bacteroidia bacterium]|nr:GNAT family N-acetyltransferase [Bacteroidia bacterium]
MEGGIAADTSIRLSPLDKTRIDLYIQLGKQTYNEHYLHLWKDGIPSEYFEAYYTPEKVQTEIGDTNLSHFIIELEQRPIGIVKLNAIEKSELVTERPSILLEKIYLLNAYSGKGIGRVVIRKIEELLRNQGVKALWLDTMKKGRTLSFYKSQGYHILGEKLLHYTQIKEEERPMCVLSKSL